MLIKDTVNVKLYHNNLKFYEDKGYAVGKSGDILTVKIDDLPNNSSTRIEVMCDYCNKKLTKRYSHFLNSRKTINKDACYGCLKHKTDDIRIMERGSFFEVNKELMKEWDYDNNVISPKEILPRSHKIINWVCENGHKWECSAKERHYGNKCPKCMGKYTEPITITHPELVSEWDYGNNNVLPNEITAGSGYKINWKCRFCEGRWKATPNARSSVNSNCPHCRMSKGELSIRSVLDEMKIGFIHEYKVHDLRGINGGMLRFDFAVMKKKEIVGFIEYDGVFHFGEVYEGSQHLVIKEHDTRKDEYCKQHDIPLLRIPYVQKEEIRKLVRGFVAIFYYDGDSVCQ